MGDQEAMERLVKAFERMAAANERTAAAAERSACASEEQVSTHKMMAAGTAQLERMLGGSDEQ